MTDLLAEAFAHTTLRTVGARDGEQQLCVDDHRWPGSEFIVAAAERDLQAFVDSAAEDVEHIWPGRDQQDGALSLLAIHLDSAIGVRTTAPERVRFTGSSWMTEPPDTPVRFDLEPGGSYEWRAAPRNSRPAGDPD